MTSKKLSLQLFVTFALGLGACAEPRPDERFGLPAVYLDLRSEDLARLKQSTFAGGTVPVDVWRGDTHKRGKLSVAGSTTVDDVKKSYNLDLKNDEGVAIRLRVNAMLADPSALRGALTWSVFRALGFDAPEAQHVAVFLNDDYLGLYLLHQTIDEHFFEVRGEEAKNIYPGIFGWTKMDSAADAERQFKSRIDPDNLSDLKNLITWLNVPSTEESRRSISTLLDVEEVGRYMAGSLFTDNADGIVNNFILYRTVENPIFSIMPWDLERTFYHPRARDETEFFDRSVMMRVLLDDLPAAKNAYECGLDHLSAELPPEEFVASVRLLVQQIEVAYAEDRFLSSYALSLDEQAESIIEHIRAQGRLLADSPSPCTHDD